MSKPIFIIKSNHRWTKDSLKNKFCIDAEETITEDFSASFLTKQPMHKVVGQKDTNGDFVLVLGENGYYTPKTLEEIPFDLESAKKEFPGYTRYEQSEKIYKSKVLNIDGFKIYYYMINLYENSSTLIISWEDVERILHHPNTIIRMYVKDHEIHLEIEIDDD